MTAQNAIASLGDAGLLLALVGRAYVVGAVVAGARRKNQRLVRSALYAAYAATALIAFSSLVMWFALLSNDYSIKYVQHHSDASMPWIYKITSFWGGLDGSIMFWVLLLSLFASLAIFVNRERHRELIPYVAAILYVVIGFFLFLIIFEKSPFDVFLTEAPHDRARGSTRSCRTRTWRSIRRRSTWASSRRRCRSPSAWRRSSPATSTTRGCSRRAAG